ncbi:unnamed protein product [Prunus armeniaca]|uniref:Uncharacterized protein n=1 Tax=Prunus armeniaca TaxID=36596 RepID=A0A6J5W7E4_PRUAR|nr:unnamed protein product [Prunus armeniaca]
MPISRWGCSDRMIWHFQKACRNALDVRHNLIYDNSEGGDFIAFVLWRIWKCRNEVVFNGVVVQAGDAVTILLKQVAEFNAAHVVDSTQGMPQNALAASGVAITPA